MGIGRNVALQRGGSGLVLLIATVALVVMVLNCNGVGSPAAPATSSPAKPPADLSSSARFVCKDFITRSGYNVPDFGEWHTWTALDNKDGTWSVGARFMGAAPGLSMRNLYVTCVMSNSGDNWSLIKLSRLQ